jgi:hypothetical protein
MSILVKGTGSLTVTACYGVEICGRYSRLSWSAYAVGGQSSWPGMTPPGLAQRPKSGSAPVKLSSARFDVVAYVRHLSCSEARRAQGTGPGRSGPAPGGRVTEAADVAIRAVLCRVGDQDRRGRGRGARVSRGCCTSAVHDALLPGSGVPGRRLTGR